MGNSPSQAAFHTPTLPAELVIPNTQPQPQTQQSQPASNHQNMSPMLKSHSSPSTPPGDRPPDLLPTTTTQHPLTPVQFQMPPTHEKAPFSWPCKPDLNLNHHDQPHSIDSLLVLDTTNCSIRTEDLSPSSLSPKAGGGGRHGHPSETQTTPVTPLLFQFDPMIQSGYEVKDDQDVLSHYDVDSLEISPHPYTQHIDLDPDIEDDSISTNSNYNPSQKWVETLDTPNNFQSMIESHNEPDLAPNSPSSDTETITQTRDSPSSSGFISDLDTFSLLQPSTTSTLATTHSYSENGHYHHSDMSADTTTAAQPNNELAFANHNCSAPIPTTESEPHETNIDLIITRDDAHTNQPDQHLHEHQPDHDKGNMIKSSDANKYISVVQINGDDNPQTNSNQTCKMQLYQQQQPIPDGPPPTLQIDPPQHVLVEADSGVNISVKNDAKLCSKVTTSSTSNQPPDETDSPPTPTKPSKVVTTTLIKVDYGVGGELFTQICLQDPVTDQPISPPMPIPLLQRQTKPKLLESESLDEFEALEEQTKSLNHHIKDSVTLTSPSSTTNNTFDLHLDLNPDVPAQTEKFKPPLLSPLSCSGDIGSGASTICGIGTGVGSLIISCNNNNDLPFQSNAKIITSTSVPQLNQTQPPPTSTNLVIITQNDANETMLPPPEETSFTKNAKRFYENQDILIKPDKNIMQNSANACIHPSKDTQLYSEQSVPSSTNCSLISTNPINNTEQLQDLTIPSPTLPRNKQGVIINPDTAVQKHQHYRQKAPLKVVPGAVAVDPQSNSQDSVETETPTMNIITKILNLTTKQTNQTEHPLLPPPHPLPPNTDPSCVINATSCPGAAAASASGSGDSFNITASTTTTPCKASIPIPPPLPPSPIKQETPLIRFQDKLKHIQGGPETEPVNITHNKTDILLKERTTPTPQPHPQPQTPPQPKPQLPPPSPPPSTHHINPAFGRLIHHKMEQCNEEKCNLIKERDQALEDLSNVESAFADVHRKYERSKGILQNFKENEAILIHRELELVQKIENRDKKLALYKEKAQEKLEQMYQEYEHKIKDLENENTRLRAQCRLLDMKLATLENDIEQKAKENAQLNALCNELISGQGSH